MRDLGLVATTRLQKRQQICIALFDPAHLELTGRNAYMPSSAIVPHVIRKSLSGDADEELVPARGLAAAVLTIEARVCGTGWRRLSRGINLNGVYGGSTATLLDQAGRSNRALSSHGSNFFKMEQLSLVAHVHDFSRNTSGPAPEHLHIQFSDYPLTLLLPLVVIVRLFVSVLS